MHFLLADIDFTKLKQLALYKWCCAVTVFCLLSIDCIHHSTILKSTKLTNNITNTAPVHIEYRVYTDNSFKGFSFIYAVIIIE